MSKPVSAIANRLSSEVSSVSDRARKGSYFRPMTRIQARTPAERTVIFAARKDRFFLPQM